MRYSFSLKILWRSVIFVALFSYFVMEGSVTSWSVPTLSDEGYESMIRFDNGFVFHVVSNTLEEHIWPTRVGQLVFAEDVEFDSPWEGRTASCFLMEEGKEEKKSVHYKDMPVDKIVGFRREENALCVLLERETEVKCVDAELGKAFLAVGVGGLVQLFNVKVSPQHGVFVTSSSGVRPVERAPTPVMPLSPPSLPLGPPPMATKWICITCNYINYPGMSVCRGCSLQRKQGPLKGSAWNFRFDFVPRRQFERLPQWMCVKCRHRDNFYIHDVCVKCGTKRKEEEEQKKKKKKRIKFQD